MIYIIKDILLIYFRGLSGDLLRLRLTSDFAVQSKSVVYSTNLININAILPNNETHNGDCFPNTT